MHKQVCAACLCKSPYVLNASCIYQQSRAHRAWQELFNCHTLIHAHCRYLPFVNNPRLVHHMILFSCSSPPVQTGDVFECLTMDDGCQTFMIGWAPGIKGGDLPATAGTFIIFQYCWSILSIAGMSLVLGRVLILWCLRRAGDERSLSHTRFDVLFAAMCAEDCCITEMISNVCSFPEVLKSQDMCASMLTSKRVTFIS